jgi:hypothetical protein
MFSDNGELLGLLAMFTDVSERRQSEQTAAHLAAIV